MRWQLSDIRELEPWVLDELDNTFVMAPIEAGTTEFEADFRTWAVESGLYTADLANELAAAELGMLSCYVTPGTPTDVRWLVAMYNAWITSFDDGVVEQGADVSHLAPVVDQLLREGVMPVELTPSLGCLVGLRDRVVALGAGGLLAEFADAQAALFTAWAREQHWIRVGKLPSLAEYAPHRGCSMTTYSIMLLHRAAPGLLSPDQRFSFSLRRIALDTCVVLGLHNDIAGCRADLTRDYELNVVPVLAEQYGWDLPTAYRTAVALLVDRWASLNHLVNDFCLRPNQDPAQVRQARALRRYVDGFHRWHRTAPRFTSSEVVPYHVREI